MLELTNAPVLFWICASILTIAAIGAAVWPLMKDTSPNPGDEMAESEGTRRVLIDQLDEIKRDGERGLINDDEAVNARTEIARRLLALDREMEKVTGVELHRGRMIYPWVAIVLIPVAAVSFYSLSGAPGMPDQPISARIEAADERQDINLLVSKVEAHLEKNPDDVRGWLTIAPVYQRMGRLDEAENAFRKGLEAGVDDKSVLGTTQSGLGQVLAMKAGGVVTKEALALFKSAQSNAPGEPASFFFEALSLSQTEKRDEAIVAWEDFISRFGEDNPFWLPAAEQTLAQLKSEANPVAAQQVVPNGPSTKDLEAAQSMSSQDRAEMIENMVAGLAARLDENADDLTGWRQLIRSYIVLGKPDEAADALQKARAALKDNPDAEAVLAADAAEHNL